MNLMPSSVKTYLESISIERFKPAFVQADPAGHIVLVGGDWFNLGVPDPLPETILERVPLLVGLLPLQGASFLIPDVQMKNGRIADAHFFHEPAGDWVVCVDVTPHHVEKQQLFQQANELQLIKQNLGNLKINAHGRIGKALQQELQRRYQDGRAAYIAALEVTFEIDTTVKDAETIRMAIVSIEQISQKIELLLGEALAWPIYPCPSGFQAIIGLIPTEKKLENVVQTLLEQILALMNDVATYFDPKEGLRPMVHLRGGVSCGDAVVANITAQAQNRVTVLSKAMNRAHELTSKAHPGQILSKFLVH